MAWRTLSVECDTVNHAVPRVVFHEHSDEPHLAALQFMNVAGIKMTCLPFKGGSPAVQARASGDAQVTFGTPPSIQPLAQTGKVKMIAVNSSTRSSSFPELASIAETGVKYYNYTFWFVLYGPAKMLARL